MHAWRSIGVVAEGDRISIGGINPWNYQWAACDVEQVEVPHPSHRGQTHRMTVYQIETASRIVTFAAGELSPNVWGFYEPALTSGAVAVAFKFARWLRK